MGLSFRKTKKVGKGVYASGSASKKGLTGSLRKKTKLGSVSVNTRGRATVSIKTPIKGLYFRTSKSIKDLFK